MVVYNFKTIQVVPSGKDFIDIVLSKTQRGTPTVIHKHYHTGRIRAFYIRKVKFSQQTFHDRLSAILDDFPVLDDIHPFYAALMNVLYDRDHYKLALGQINTARHLVDNIGKEYVRLLKYGDSLYSCKQLKRAALGRMCTLIKKQDSSLQYLEQVRQHLARLPTIDPNTRTLLLCGYPNVGKSSFINKITRADVDVQAYPFTTKSLFVGHTDYKYLPWQVIDTPGILDKPLDAFNTIEMQSVTALAHLRAAVIFLIDISEQCGFSIEQQVSLFNSIKPLFANKPLVIVTSKVDVRKWEDLDEEKRELITSAAGASTPILPLSSITEEGISKVKEAACDLLLAQRVETKLSTMKNSDSLSKLHLALPKPRDKRVRSPNIPSSVFEMRLNGEDVGIEKKIEKKFGHLQDYDPYDNPEDPSKFSTVDWRDTYLLENEEWKHDIIPEIMDGRNIADFIDPDILAKLEELEREEERLEEQMEQDEDTMNITFSEDDLKLLSAIKKRRIVNVMRHREKKALNGTRLPKMNNNAENTTSKFTAHLEEMGIDSATATHAARRARERSRSRPRSESRMTGRKRAREESVKPFHEEGDGYRNVKQKLEAVQKAWKNQKVFNRDAKKGEADRVILDKKPKHLFSGKRGIGKTQRI